MQTLTDFRSSHVPERTAQSWILRNSEKSAMCVANYMRVYWWANKCAHLTCTFSSLECDCYRPAVAILQPLSSHYAFIPANKNSVLFKMYIFTLFNTCMSLTICKLTLFNSGSVCMGLIVHLSSAHETDMKISAGSGQVQVTASLSAGKELQASNA